MRRGTPPRYAIVGIQQLITITIQTALATRVAAAQARRVREKYFEAVLSQPVRCGAEI